MLAPGVTAAAQKATREMKMIKLPDTDDLSGGSMDRFNMGKRLSGKSEQHGDVNYRRVNGVRVERLPANNDSI
jgi:hypothetical protein